MTAQPKLEAETITPPPGGEVIPFPVLPVPLAAIAPPEIITGLVVTATLATIELWKANVEMMFGLSRMLCSPEALAEIKRRAVKDAT
jgi:hypothetical protein